jgi:isopentenyl-diphosphate delta-isomerase
MLHRAFSVFLFSPEGTLLLQQRALSKITFAGIWANTCCSHPLAGSGEEEEAGAAGVVRAARRKLEQELGVPPEDVPAEAFTWVTRVHYAGASAARASGAAAAGGSAAGGSAAGAAAETLWGEHEIDWILLCTPAARARVAPNANEVAAVREFSQAELRAWMREGGGAAAVSPWFGVMEASGLLYKWWDAVLARRIGDVLERDVIHRQHDLEALAAGGPAGSVPPARALEAAAAASRGDAGPGRPPAPVATA